MKDNPADQLNKLITEYKFPLEVLQDVNNRLKDNQTDTYILQQVRYLKNHINIGNAKKRKEDSE